jgi:hypothetical protein
MVVEEFVEDGGLFEDDEFWEVLRGIKRKKREDEVEEEEGKKEKEEVKIEEEVKEEEVEVKEDIKEEKSDINSDNKYKRRREKDEDRGERGPYKKNTVSKYFENSCQLLANGITTLSEIFQEFPSMYARHYKTLERIVYERDRLKKRPLLEVTWIYGPSGMGEMEWADENIGSYDYFYKVGNYYLGPTDNNKNLVYNPLENEKYSDLL